MVEISRLSLFLTAAFILVLSPGPSVLFVIAKGVNQGWKAGITSVLGIEFATLIHVGAATLGVSTVLLASPVVFNVVKFASVMYLIYLGLRQLTTQHTLHNTAVWKQQTLRSVFSQGVLVELLNPQTAFFFLAFLPQFVNPAQGSVPIQFLILGIIFVMIAIVTEGTYALLAGTAGRWLKEHPQFLHVQHYLVGIVYLGLGLMAALASHG